MFIQWKALSENFKVHGKVSFFKFLWFKIQTLQIKITDPCITPNEPLYQHSDNDNDNALSAKHVSDIKLMKSVCEPASYIYNITEISFTWYARNKSSTWLPSAASYTATIIHMPIPCHHMENHSHPYDHIVLPQKQPQSSICLYSSTSHKTPQSSTYFKLELLLWYWNNPCVF